MSSTVAAVRAGRIVPQQPIGLPDGAQVRLVPVPALGAESEEDRAALHASLLRSEAERRSGPGADAALVLDELDHE